MTSTLPSLIQGKKITVMGLGVQGGGAGVVRYLARHGAVVTCTDLKPPEALTRSLDSLAGLPVRYVLGQHDERDFVDADIVIKGPSVRWDNPYILAAIKSGARVEMETALYLKHTESQTIGITGTRGKSTTTYLISHLLTHILPERTVRTAGNLPDMCALDLLDIEGAGDITVLELSSWQLSGCAHAHVSPAVAVFTNLYPDHLNYYTSMDEYFQDKAAIYLSQSDSGILIASQQFGQQQYLERMRREAPRVQVVPPSEISVPDCLQGAHNSQNVALAIHAVRTIATDRVISDEQIEQTLQTYVGPPYRQQLIATYKHLSIINDSTSTTPVALSVALSRYASRETDRVVLIMGGTTKHLPTADLIHDLAHARPALQHIALVRGTFTQEIYDAVVALGVPVSEQGERSFGEFVGEIMELCRQSPDPVTLVFSPGATSFGQFAHEFDRARQFDEAVFAIITSWTHQS